MSPFWFIVAVALTAEFAVFGVVFWVKAIRTLL
jgi:hypothetical protein